MLPEIIYQYPYFFIGVIAILVNIPMGYLREGCAKFSLAWFFWIHASIPILIYLRWTLHTSKLFIPVAIMFAIVGQIVGSRYRRKKMPQAEHDALEQISDLRLMKNAGCSAGDADIQVVLLNMGGPQENKDVPDFLKRLFLDVRLIRFPLAFLLQPLFANLLVFFRAKAAQHRYQLIGGGSPILRSTMQQAAALQAELKKRGRNLNVTICFNYSYPLPSDTVEEIKLSNKKFVLPVSLYPHYSEATTGSSVYFLQKEAAQKIPDVRFLDADSYYLNDSYIQAFADRIRQQIKPNESLSDFYLLFSAHGLPLYFLKEGDVYPFQIAQTVAKVINSLGRQDAWSISYQSAVGPLVWLKPSTESMISALAKRGVKKLLVVPISFVTDHIETLCEIDIEYRTMAKELGIKDFRMSKALESHPGFISALADSAESALRYQQKQRECSRV
ncbi:MAG: ferrochelatase [Candidatus Omnitrophota bacterium]